MRIGDLVYCKSIRRYGFVNELNTFGNVKNIRVFNHETNTFDIISVLNKTIEAVTFIKSLILFIRGFIQSFQKQAH